MDVLIATVAGAVTFYLIFLRRYKTVDRQLCICDPKKYDFEYVSKPVKVPVLRGFFLILASRLVNSFFGHMVLANIVATQGGFDKFRAIKMSEFPSFFPNVSFDGECASEDKRHESCSDSELEKVIELEEDHGDDFSFHSIASYVSRYKSGQVTPTEVAERLLIGIKSTSELRSVIKYDADYIRETAAASTERYNTNTTLSPVDGIFVIVKDEFAVKGFKYSKGTSFMGEGSVATFDSVLIVKLKDLGAIVVGVANMHELGLGTTGNNSNKGFGTCRNPYDVNHYTGGSSSGSAASVSSGLCCMGLGTDGGGSIRIPSSYCGVVGLKPTFARLTLADAHGLSYSVGHAGPICGSVKDAAVFYALLAGPHPRYPLGMHQPIVRLPEFGRNLNGMKIGIDRRFFKNCEKDVFSICNESLGYLTKCGASLEEIQIPELQEIMLAHRIIILCEMSAGINHDFAAHFGGFTHPTRILFKVGTSLTALDYIQANKQRTRAIRYLTELFESVDAIVTPTAGHCAPKIVASELSVGMFNGEQDVMNMRYAGMANLSGCPAISLPVGYNDAGLPVGLQFMSAWWKEDVVLKIAENVEKHIRLRKPKVFADLLEP